MSGDDGPKETKAERKARTKLEAQERKAKRKAARAAKKAAAGGAATKTVTEDDGGADAPGAPTDAEVAAAMERGDAGALTAEQMRVAAVRAVTGVLASTPEEMDVKFDSFSLMVGGNLLVTDCRLELSQGHRYGLIGDNGTGKSNILAAIAQKEVPLPEHIDVFHLHEEAPASELSGVEAVIQHIVDEAARLEALAERIMEESGMEDERLMPIYERLDELDPTGSEPRARLILSGLGFCDRLIPMDRKTKHMSGGWRMRVSLAKALFAAPSLLLLDEPTNHLDLEACVWLEEHLANYPKCLFVISHSEDFLNAVCTDTVWLKPNPFHLTEGPGSKGAKLRYYGGNYDTFVKVIGEEERVHVRAYEKQQADLQKLADFVRINKANGKANAAKSKKKVMEKILANAVEKPQVREPTLSFVFPETDPLVRCRVLVVVVVVSLCVLSVFSPRAMTNIGPNNQKGINTHEE